MTTAAPIPLDRTDRADAHASSEARGCGASLAQLAVGTHAQVATVDVQGEAGPWLEAVGIAPGELVVVLRRAPFGGPLHIRTGAGGEFALCRSLANAIVVHPPGASRAARETDPPEELREEAAE